MESQSPSDAQLEAAGELLIGYTDRVNAGHEPPPLEDYLAACSDGVVRDLAREGIESSLWLFALRDALQPAD